jgi:hypothetical protein
MRHFYIRGDLWQDQMKGSPRKSEIEILYFVHNVLAQHNLISLGHRLARQSTFRSTKQGVVA